MWAYGRRRRRIHFVAEYRFLMDHVVRGRLLTLSLAFLALTALPVGAAEITQITWDVTGGGSISGTTFTGGSVTWTPETPLMTPCTDCSEPAFVVILLTGPRFATVITRQMHFLTISIANVQMGYAVHFGPFFNLTFPGSTTTSVGHLGWGRSLPYGPVSTYSFTLENEVRTLVPEPATAALQAAALLALGLLGLAAGVGRALSHRRR